MWVLGFAPRVSAGMIRVLAYLPTLWVRGVCADMLWSVSVATGTVAANFKILEFSWL